MTARGLYATPREVHARQWADALQALWSTTGERRDLARWHLRLLIREERGRRRAFSAYCLQRRMNAEETQP